MESSMKAARIVVGLFAAGLIVLQATTAWSADDGDGPPNILFAFADDWGVHAGAYGTEGIATPTFDRIAADGVLFENAFAAAPSCTPSRGAVLTGQHPWRLGPGANLHSTLPVELPVYPLLLEDHAGYFIGFTRKGWGPGANAAGGRTERPEGPSFKDFATFLEARPADQPFCFWFGSKDPHRKFDARLREEMGIDPAAVVVPPYLPDVPEVREDIANYYAAVQRFDTEVGELIAMLEAAGELDNTLVVISSDHGWPFPRGKSNLYDAGSRVPLAVRWPAKIPGNRRVTDFTNLVDLAPTFLEVAGVTAPTQITGRSLMPVLSSDKEGRTTPHRSYVLLAKERHHGHCREDVKGYPSRAIRTAYFLYIRNDEPDRWPAGAPHVSSSQDTFSDIDDGPAKRWMMEHANDPEVVSLFRASFDKRPAEELYDLRTDPEQLVNRAGDPAYAAVKEHLAATLQDETAVLGDPRAFGEGDVFDAYEYRAGYGYEVVEPSEAIKAALDLE